MAGHEDPGVSTASSREPSDIPHPRHPPPLGFHPRPHWDDDAGAAGNHSLTFSGRSSPASAQRRDAWTRTPSERSQAGEVSGASPRM